MRRARPSERNGVSRYGRRGYEVRNREQSSKWLRTRLRPSTFRTFRPRIRGGVDTLNGRGFECHIWWCNWGAVSVILPVPARALDHGDRPRCLHGVAALDRRTPLDLRVDVDIRVGEKMVVPVGTRVERLRVSVYGERAGEGEEGEGEGGERRSERTKRTDRISSLLLHTIRPSSLYSLKRTISPPLPR